MKTLLLVLSLFWVLPSSAAPATDAALRELFSAMDAHRLLDSAYQQLDTRLQTSLAQMDVKPNQKPLLQAFAHRYGQWVRSQLSWVVLEPKMAQVYAQVFTEEDIKVMTAFYRSPTGKKMLEKMPLLLQESMGIVQQAMQNLEPQLNQMQQELAEQLKATP